MNIIHNHEKFGIKIYEKDTAAPAGMPCVPVLYDRHSQQNTRQSFLTPDAVSPSLHPRDATSSR